MGHENGKYHFVMKTDGMGHLFGPLADGPFPEHYEPLESPLPKNPLSSQRINPAARVLHTRESALAEDLFCSGDDRYPIVCTTIRLAEARAAGQKARLTDPDSTRVIFLLIRDPKDYHDFAVAKRQPGE